mgnify:CR=1 FL=1
MSDSDSDSDYAPPTDTCDTNGYSEITKKQEEQLLKLKELGELRTENILEIQHLEQLIKDSSMTVEQKYQTGKCLEMLINCSNAYINSFANRNH